MRIIASTIYLRIEFVVTENGLEGENSVNSENVSYK